LANVAGKFSEMKITRRERHHVCGGNPSHAEALTRYNRAERKASKQALACYADEVLVCIPMGEDADAHVIAFEASWERGYFGGDDSDYYEGCGCALCLVDNGIIGWSVALAIGVRDGECRYGLTLSLLGAGPDDDGPYPPPPKWAEPN
jgi:hypothetical protein